MPGIISSDLFQLGAVKLVAGAVPATPALQLARLSSESLDFQPSTATSPELDSSGQVRDSMLTGARTTGAVEMPLTRHAFFENALESVFRSTFGAGTKGDGSGPPPATSAVGADELIVGNALHLYMLEKRFPDPVTPGQYLYHRVNKAAVSSISLSVAAAKEVSASVAYSGGTLDLVETLLAGETYVDPGTHPLFTAPEVSEVSVAGLTNALCFQNFSLEFNSNVRGVECIGTLGFKEQVLGRFEASIRGTAYFYSNDLLDYLVNQQSFPVSITLEDPNGNKYKFDFPRCKMTAGGANASGTNQDVVSNIAIQALYDPTRLYSVMCTRTHV